jgi:hypothetical protein
MKLVRRGFLARLAWIVLAIVTAGQCSTNERTPVSSNAAAVRALLEAQQAAWNRGDIEEFMAGY